MALLGKRIGWVKETMMLSHWKEYWDMFPHIPLQSCFNRRQFLHKAANVLRQFVFGQPDLTADGQSAINSMLVPVVKFHLVPGSTDNWVDFGKCTRKKINIFGFKLHLLVSLVAPHLHVELAPDSTSDMTGGSELLTKHTDLIVDSDKGYISTELTQYLLTTNRLELMTLARANQAHLPWQAVSRTFNDVRQLIETVNGQLTEQLDHDHTFLRLMYSVVD